MVKKIIVKGGVKEVVEKVCTSDVKMRRRRRKNKSAVRKPSLMATDMGKEGRGLKERDYETRRQDEKNVLFNGSVMKREIDALASL